MKTALSAASVAALVVAFSISNAAADVRTIDGSGNNLLNPNWGRTGTDLIRGASGCLYEDNRGAPMPRANPRAISNAVSAQSAAGLGNARNLSSMVWQWGQFIDHDFALVDESSEAMNIAVPMGDPVFDPAGTGTRSIPFMRSVHTGGVTSPREMQNALTHWIDGSMVYGSDTTRAAALRSFSGGRLAVSSSPGGDMMPYNTGNLPNAMSTSSSFFLGGDVRANEQSGLLAMHTVFVREHNRLAGQIAAANPSWSDEQVYQRARKLVGAQIQAITYNEWLPALMGAHAPGAYTGYDASVNPSIDTAFSTAAFRIGHTMLNDQLLRVNADGSTFAGGHLNLFQQFFNPAVITGPAALDAVVRGLAHQQANEIDTQVIDGVRNLLFGGPDGRDLIALNIQRGRDHGLQDYNTMRTDYGLARITAFSQITSDPALAAALQSVFGDVDHIDPWIGMFAEDHLPGASIGETAAAIFNDQFIRLRAGDRFFYLNDSDLSAQDLLFLNSVTLADILRWNTGATDLHDNVFFAIPAPGAATLSLVAGVLALRRRRPSMPAA